MDDERFAAIGEEHYTCPVCGYPELDHSPYDEHECASYDICPCCGIQFGYDDTNCSHEALRAEWVANGARWWSDARPYPQNWSAIEQLEKAGLEVMVACPCCSYLTFEAHGYWDICAVCFWENDPLQSRIPDLAGGANKVSLNEARANFATYRVSELRFRKNVRDPLPEEIPVNKDS